VASGQQPGIALLERCVMRAERSADVPALRLLMGRLDLLNYKIVGAAAKVRLQLTFVHLIGVLAATSWACSSVWG
jgi:hypothetical protein